jgi:hypothetical protein
MLSPKDFNIAIPSSSARGNHSLREAAKVRIHNVDWHLHSVKVKPCSFDYDSRRYIAGGRPIRLPPRIREIAVTMPPQVTPWFTVTNPPPTGGMTVGTYTFTVTATGNDTAKTSATATFSVMMS